MKSHRSLIAILICLLCISVFFNTGSLSDSNLHQQSIASEQRRDKKEVTVYVTRTGEKYHRSDCRYLRRSKIPKKKSEAIAEGYEPCKVCKP